jgi:hypothetical protein
MERKEFLELYVARGVGEVEVDVVGHTQSPI